MLPSTTKSLEIRLCNHMKYWLQVQAEIMTVWSDENEVDAAEPGENVKLKLKNVEEDVSLFHMPSNSKFTDKVFQLSQRN